MSPDSHKSIITRAETQQKLMGSMLTTQETQYKLIAQQVKEEQERRTRKPKIEIITNNITEPEMRELEAEQQVLNSKPGRTVGWNPEYFRFQLKNVGSAALLNPVVKITAYPVIVYISPTQTGTNDKEHSIQLELQRTITPFAESNATIELPLIYRKLPSNIKSWELVISVFGDNYHHDFSIHFTVPSPPQAPQNDKG